MLRGLPAWRWVLTLALACGHVHSKPLHSFAGPFIAFAHRFDVCPSDDAIVINLRNSHFNPTKPFERQSIWGNLTFKKDLDDAMAISATLAVRSNNQWKENAFVFNFPTGACSSIRDHVPDLFRVFAVAASVPLNKKAPCRIPSGEYYVSEKQPVSWEFPMFRTMPYGHYRLNVTMWSGPRKKLRACELVDCEVIPKP